jgi:hypothetical protein
MTAPTTGAAEAGNGTSNFQTFTALKNKTKKMPLNESIFIGECQLHNTR